ncbi:proto-oncogene c-Fos-like [Mizuhopecten yessoensis]|uniref:Proto-oncogene c-FOS n=1 Tax=Mizuhopecten yessoensis TaxID=6573 RepID=A0A210QNJ0_MIZYE|nr:proto-oncogene c-Fos-like [Mizuhopecten yessoensis]OWF50304.1 Proto-oncogene c-FOS [Mizuhopecten yessoensis]
MTTMADFHILNVDPVMLGEVEDENLMKAIEESRRERSTMPLIKQELRYTIQYRRLSSGQGEMVVEEDTQPEYKLTNDEVRKRYRRREQNRQSSVRCRGKRKEYGKTLEKTVSELELKQCDLQLDIQRLNLEKKHLEKLIKRHLKHGKCKSRTTRQTTAKQLEKGSGDHDSKVEVQNIEQTPTTKTSNRLISVNKHVMRKCRPHKLSSNQVGMVSLLSVH